MCPSPVLFAQHHVGSPPSGMQLPSTPPGAVPLPSRNMSSSPVRTFEAAARHASPDRHRLTAAGLRLKQVGTAMNPRAMNPTLTISS
jgi:hypothetical protein